MHLSAYTEYFIGPLHYKGLVTIEDMSSWCRQGKLNPTCSATETS